MPNATRAPSDQHMLKGRRKRLESVRFTSGRTHPGLWMDKYLPMQTPKGGGASDEAKEAKTKLLRQLAGATVPDGYREAFQLREAALEAAEDTFTGTATVLGRLVVGLGEPTPLEVGLHLDHTWGVPVLPGSALKGLAAAAAHKLAEDPAWRAPRSPEDPTTGGASHRALFGTTENAGLVRFLDAWWVPETGDTALPIDLDVMTVHHPDYYQGSGDEPPSDMDSPTPISFLTVRGRYRVAVAGPPAWCDAALQLLEEGLRELGLGAKTNAGYGRMELKYSPPREPTSLSLEVTALLRDCSWDAFSQVLRAAFQGANGWSKRMRKLARPSEDAGYDLERARKLLQKLTDALGEDVTNTQRKDIDKLLRKLKPR